jgi:hypothetical protein
MVLGIIGCGVTGVVAVVLEHSAISTLKRSGSALTGGGMALAGLALDGGWNPPQAGQSPRASSAWWTWVTASAMRG